MKASPDAMARTVEREFFGGSIRLHILHHAGRAPVFGAGLIEELRRHGYRVSPGTLYPILHTLERNGYLKSRVEIVGGKRRRSYVATTVGKSALRLSRPRILELVRELFDHESSRTRSASRSRISSHSGEAHGNHHT